MAMEVTLSVNQKNECLLKNNGLQYHRHVAILKLQMELLKMEESDDTLTTAKLKLGINMYVD